MYNGNNQFTQQTPWQGQTNGQPAQGQAAPRGNLPPNVYPPQQGYPVYPQQTPYPQQPYPQQTLPQGYPQSTQPAGGYGQGATPPGYPPRSGYPQGYPQGGVPMPAHGQQIPPQGYGQRPAQPGYPAGQPMAAYGGQPVYPPQQAHVQPGYPPQQAFYPPNMQPPAALAAGQGQPAGFAARLAALPWMQIALFGVLPALFLAGMFVPALGFMKILFLVGVMAGIAMLWVKPVVGANLRLLLTAGYAVLAVIALISLLSGSMAPADTTTSGSTGTQTSTQTTGTATTVSGEEVPATLGVMEDVGTVDATAAVSDTTTSAVDTGEAIRQLQSFFHSWSVNRTDEMVALSAPSWQASVEDPKKALFGILANRTVLDHTVVSTTGTDADSTRTSTVDATIDKGNGRDPVKYRFQVILLKESGVWYVDPRSLTSVEAVEEAASATPTPDPAASATAATTTSTGIAGTTVLYYNPDGGTKYHIDPNCPDVAARFTPLAGHFTYSQINDAAYVKLKRCSRCNAPVRLEN